MNRLHEIGIGELAQRTAVNIETIRYYEKIGLLPPPRRSPGGNRLFSHEEAKRLIFIRRARELGFNLNEVRNLISMVEGGSNCGAIREAALGHLAVIRAKISDLRQMERTLAATAAQCKGGNAPMCPIIDALSGPRPA